MKITGIVLAGGKSSRMEGADKGLIYFKGKHLIEYSLELLSTLCETIYVSSKFERYRAFGYGLIKDEISEIGPVGGIYSALNVSQTDINIFLPCDAPFLNKELLEYLLKEIENHDAVVPVTDDNTHSTILVIKKACKNIIFEEIEKNNYKLMFPLKRCKTKFVEIKESMPFYNKNLFANLNSFADIKALL